MSRVIVVTDGVQGPPGPGVLVRTTAEWEANDLVLARGRVGYDEDTGTLKVGDGSTAWSALPGISGEGSGSGDGGGGGTSFFAEAIVPADADVITGNGTEVDLLDIDGETVMMANVPRSMGVGLNVLILSGENAGLWTVTESGPCTQIEVLGGQQVVVSPYPDATTTFYGLNNPTTNVDTSAPATSFVREAGLLSVDPVTSITAGYGLDVTNVDGAVTIDMEKRRPIPSVTAGYHDGSTGNAALAHVAGDPEDVRIPAVSEIDGIALAAPRVAALGNQPISANNGFWEVFEVQPNGTNHELYYEVDDFGGSTVEVGDIYFHRVHVLNGLWESDSIVTGTPVHVGSGDKYGNAIIFTLGDGLDCNFTNQRYVYNNSSSGLSAETLGDAVDELVDASGLAAAGFGKTLPLFYLFFTNQDLTNCLHPGVPAGLKIGFDGQTNSAQNGVYLSNGVGGVNIATRQDIVSPANFGLRVTALSTVETEAIAVDRLGFGELGTFIERPEATIAPTVWHVSTEDGTNYFLKAEYLSLQALFPMLGGAFAPAWNDYYVSTNTQLTKNHQVVFVGGTSGPIILSMPPHLGLVVPHFIHNVGTHDVTIIPHTSESDIDFEQVVSPGDAGLVLPNQYDWHYIPFVHRAEELSYDNSTSGLSATGLQEAIDELAAGPQPFYQFTFAGSSGYVYDNSGDTEEGYDFTSSWLPPLSVSIGNYINGNVASYDHIVLEIEGCLRGIIDSGGWAPGDCGLDSVQVGAQVIGSDGVYRSGGLTDDIAQIGAFVTDSQTYHATPYVDHQRMVLHLRVFEDYATIVSEDSIAKSGVNFQPVRWSTELGEAGFYLLQLWVMDTSDTPWHWAQGTSIKVYGYND